MVIEIPQNEKIFEKKKSGREAVCSAISRRRANMGSMGA